jgi:hypothetical protein
MTYDLKTRRILSRLGYFNYQQGLIFRHLDQEGSWNTHLQNCRRFILNAIEILKPEKITVLGSGWLLDFPLAEITEMGIEVILTDIVHPPDVIKQVAPLGNVRLVEDDVTGGVIKEVWTKTWKYSYIRRLRTLKNISVPEYRFTEDPGLVISLNLLSQLDFLPVRRLRRKGNISLEEMTGFRREIQQKHLELLGSFRSVLISDYLEITTENDGSQSEERTLLIELPKSETREEWIWDFEHESSDFHGKRLTFRVAAILI